MSRRESPRREGVRVLALAGSLRRGSLNRRLLQAAAALAPTGMEVAIYEGLADVPLFDEDLEQATGGGPEAVHRLRAAVVGADAVLISTPEYNQSIPGGLKNALDWLSREAADSELAPNFASVLAPVLQGVLAPAYKAVLAPVLQGKPVAVVGVTAGRWGTRLAQAALRQVLLAMDARLLTAPNLYAADGARLFDTDGRLTHAPTAATLRAVLARLAELIERR